jgi:hypothetical protein
MYEISVSVGVEALYLALLFNLVFVSALLATSYRAEFK